MDNLKHYMAMVEGLFAFRAVPPEGEPPLPGGLSQETEAELAEVQNDLWRRMTGAERDAAELAIEELKRKWAT